MTKQEFPTWSIAAGFGLGSYTHLSSEDRSRLTRLIARIAEQAYRRGAYQATKLAQSDEGLLPKDIYGWRHGMSLDKSPWLDNATVEPSVERLFAECPELEALGFSAHERRDNDDCPTPKDNEQES